MERGHARPFRERDGSNAVWVGDLWETAAGHDLVREERLAHVHDRDLLTDALNGGRASKGGRELGGHAIDHVRVNLRRERVAGPGYDARPVIGRVQDEVVAKHHQLLLALVTHPLLTHILRVELDVLGDALQDQQPEMLRPQRERVVIRKGGAHGADEAVVVSSLDQFVVELDAAALVYETLWRLLSGELIDASRIIHHRQPRLRNCEVCRDEESDLA